MPGRSSFNYPHKRITHKVIPIKSGVHRLSCIVLYRHLLNQIPRSPLNRSLLSQVIRAEFRQDAKLRIHSKIRESLQVGYQTLSLLQSLRRAQDHAEQETSIEQSDADTIVHAQGTNGQQLQESSTEIAPKDITSSTIDSDVSRLENPREAPDLTTGERKARLYPLNELKGNLSKQIANLNIHLENLTISYPKVIAPTSTPPILTPYPGGNKILDRPLPTSALTGRRRVPQLVNATGLPFLRVKKPQPALISKILRDKQSQKVKRFDQLTRLHEAMVIAQDEDEWEGQMKEIAIAENKLAEFTEDALNFQAVHDQQQQQQQLQQQQFPQSTDVNDRQSEYYNNEIPHLGTTHLSTITHSIKVVHKKLSLEEAKQKDLSKKFWEIVKAERKLADEEKEAARKEKVQKWVEKMKRKVLAKGSEWEDRSDKGRIIK